jgi:hypothetical protein
VHRDANSFKTVRNPTAVLASTCCGREAMQGAERRLVVSVAPEPPWLPPQSLGKRRLFFGRIASGGVWSVQKMAHCEAGLEHVLGREQSATNYVATIG